MTCIGPVAFYLVIATVAIIWSASLRNFSMSDGKSLVIGFVCLPLLAVYLCAYNSIAMAYIVPFLLMVPLLLTLAFVAFLEPRRSPPELSS